MAEERLACHGIFRTFPPRVTVRQHTVHVEDTAMCDGIQMTYSISRRALLLSALPALVTGFAAASAQGPVGSVGHDDRAELLALARSGTIRLESNRVYRLAGPLELPSGLSVLGDPTSVISPEGNFPALVTSGSGVRLSGFTIRGRRDAYPSVNNHGIFVDWRRRRGEDIRITSVRIEDVAGIGILALASAQTRSGGFSATDCEVRRTGAHGIIAQDYIDDVAFERNRVEATGLLIAGPGITASRYGRRVVVRDNVCRGSPASVGVSVHGISIDMCAEADCRSNVVSGWPRGYGIEAAGIAGGTIASNVISGCLYGIGLSGQRGVFINQDLVVENNEISDSEAAGLYSFIHQSDGQQKHRDIAFRSNKVERVTGTGIGVGAFLTEIDGLVIDDLEVTGSRYSGVSLVDCPNHSLSRIWSHGNNAGAAAAHAGLAIHWRKLPPGRRGTNRLSGNRVEQNGGGRNLIADR